MKHTIRILSFIFALSILFVGTANTALASGAPSLNNTVCDAAALVSLDYGDVLYSYGGDQVLDPGGTVKIMTAYLAYDILKDRLEEYVYISRSMVTGAGNNIELREGESIKIKDLLYATLLKGANDAAMALAITASGSTGEFVTRMNDTAKQLGMMDTVYANCTGFHANNAKTTLGDTLTLAKAFYGKIFLMGASSASSYTIPATSLSAARVMHNRNYLLSTSYTSMYYRSDARGILYGGTAEAGYSLITTVVFGGLTYLSVVMGAPSYSESNNAYDTTALLLDYANEGFGLVKLLLASEPMASLPVTLSKQSDAVTLIPARDVTVFMPLDYNEQLIEYKVETDVTSLTAPIDSKMKVGRIVILYDGEEIAECELVTANALTRSVLLEFSDAAVTFFMSPLFICTVIFAIVGGILYVIFKAKAIAREKQNEQADNGR